MCLGLAIIHHHLDGCRVELLIADWVCYYIDRKNDERNKTPMIILVIGIFAFAIYFLVLLPMLRK